MDRRSYEDPRWEGECSSGCGAKSIRRFGLAGIELGVDLTWCRRCQAFTHYRWVRLDPGYSYTAYDQVVDTSFLGLAMESALDKAAKDLAKTVEKILAEKQERVYGKARNTTVVIESL